MQPINKVFPALDCSIEQGLEIARAIASHPVIMGFKLNRTIDQLLYRKPSDPDVFEILGGLEKPIWLDAKFHDVPPTVAARIQPHVLAGYVRYITVMAKGEVDMMMDAVAAAGDQVSIVAVTELTSNTEEQVDLGSGHSPKASVINLARNAVLSGIRHLVCSPQELPVIVKRRELACLTPFVPGISVGGKTGEGQSRVGTVTSVLEVCPRAVCVIGTAFTKAQDPLEVANQIAEEIEAIRA